MEYPKEHIRKICTPEHASPLLVKTSENRFFPFFLSPSRDKVWLGFEHRGVYFIFSV
jgi:hypothetical protein